MKTVTCDKCGETISTSPQTIKPIAFTIVASDDKGPGGTQRNATWDMRATPVVNRERICCDWDFCESCLFEAFYIGVQNEWLRRHPNALGNRPEK